jgi:hypothetical protein
MVKKTKKKEKESDLFSLHMKVSKRGTLEKWVCLYYRRIAVPWIKKTPNEINLC